MSTDAQDMYGRVARDLPNAVSVGAAFITMVDVVPGAEIAYNRWYEDDHFSAGAMSSPWIFSGRRWVAPLSLRRRRPAVEAPIASHPHAGCFVHTYWIIEGHEADVQRWMMASFEDALLPHGRAHARLLEDGSVELIGRRHVYTGYHQFAFEVKRDLGGPLGPVHALEHPYAGMVLEVVELPDAHDSVIALRDALIPRSLHGTPCAQVLAFQPSTWAGRPATVPKEPIDETRRLCLLWFLQSEPHGCYPEMLDSFHAELRAMGGSLALSSAFVPTVPGTDAYMKELFS